MPTSKTSMLNYPKMGMQESKHPWNPATDMPYHAWPCMTAKRLQRLPTNDSSKKNQTIKVILHLWIRELDKRFTQQFLRSSRQSKWFFICGSENLTKEFMEQFLSITQKPDNQSDSSSVAPRTNRGFTEQFLSITRMLKQSKDSWAIFEHSWASINSADRQTDRQTERNQVQEVNLKNREQKPCMLLQLLLLSHHRRN